MKEFSYKYDFSVVVPVFENDQLLEELVSELNHVFISLDKNYQLILVDDSISNSSWPIIEKIYKEQEYVIAIRLSRNYGQHNATICGFQYVEAPWVVTIDDDLEIPPAEIKKLIDKQIETDADVVSGNYGRKKGNPIYNLFNSSLKDSGEKIKREKSTKSSFRLISKNLTDKLLEYPHNFVFIDRVLMWHTQFIENVDVINQKSRKKQSGYNFNKKFNLLSNIVLYFSTIPLKAMTYLSFVISILAFGIGSFKIYRKLIYDTPIMGYTSLLVAILFSTGLILFALGLIAENLRKIYTILNHQPSYNIKRILKR